MDKSPNIVADIENRIVKKSYVTLGMDNMVSMTADSDTYYYHADARSSLKALSDSTGKAVATYAYTAFGEAVATNTPQSLTPNTSVAAQRYRYTGREFNPHSGNYYFRYRTYNPSIGAFTTRDPLGYVDGMSQYNGYFAAVLMVDPMGLVIRLKAKNNVKVKTGGSKTLNCSDGDPLGRVSLILAWADASRDENALSLAMIIRLLGRVPGGQDWAWKQGAGVGGGVIVKFTPEDKKCSCCKSGIFQFKSFVLGGNNTNWRPDGPRDGSSPKGPIFIDYPNDYLFPTSFQRFFRTELHCVTKSGSKKLFQFFWSVDVEVSAFSVEATTIVGW